MPQKKRKTDKKMFVKLRETTHTLLKVLAAEERRNINGDLADDIITLGIEEYKKSKKNNPQCNM